VVVAFREGIFRSRDQGATWTAATGLPSFLFPGAMAADPAVPGAVYLVDLESVHRSVDGGATWTTTSSGFPREQGIFSLAVFDDTLYAAARGLGIFKNFAAGD
jgi:hypothetical protein